MKIVGVVEAKAHWSQLLDSAAKGESIIITRHVAPVAQLVSAKPACGTLALGALVNEIRRTRKGRSLR